jgi:RNA polymerase sigma-70 factor (ECF subfamily)
MDLVTGSTVALDYLEELTPEPSQPKGTPAIYSAEERKRVVSMGDPELVGECVTGSSLAFDELVTRYRTKVVRLVTSMLGPGSEAEDVAQDVFVKVYLSLGKFRGDASFSTYLYTVTVNRCRDELRRNKLRRFFSFEDWFSNNGSQLTQENEQAIDGDERRSAIRKAMKRLPVQTQMLLHLREIEELSYKELADIFAVEIGTIKSRLARARDRLREEIYPYIKDGTLPGEKGK